MRGAWAVLRRPDLWVAGIRQGRRLVPRGWWRRRPFLPVPAGEYVRFRMLTQYGAADARPAPADLVAYLEWCKRYG